MNKASDLIIDDKTARIIDLIEQIRKVDNMIDMHHNHSKNVFMAEQYEFKRDEFVLELQGLMKGINLSGSYQKVA